MNEFGAALQALLDERSMSVEDLAARMRALLRPEIQVGCEPYPTTGALHALMTSGWHERPSPTGLFLFVMGEALALDEEERVRLFDAYLADAPA